MRRHRSRGALILLSALIVYGWTGLAICKAACAEAAGLRPGVPVQAAETSSAGKAPCHGHAAPAPEPTPKRSSDPEASPCCCALDLATPGEIASLADGSPGVPAAPSRSVEEMRPSRTIAFAWHPPRRLNSPFESQNPPLLS